MAFNTGSKTLAGAFRGTFRGTFGFVIKTPKVQGTCETKNGLCISSVGPLSSM